MIKFIKKWKQHLPYNRKQYLEYLNNDLGLRSEWAGVSFQLNKFENDILLDEYIRLYEKLFINIILDLDNGSFWVINHDKIKTDWFPNREKNLKLLRNKFKENGISNSFNGALILCKEDLLYLTTDLITYPFSVFNKVGVCYDDIDISNGELKFIIKISHHMNIDFLSTDKELLKRIINEYSSEVFNVKLYRGTELT